MKKPILRNEIKAEINGTSTITNNIEEAKEYALELKEYYSKLVFNDGQINEATKERASVNKVIKKIADYRKDIVAKFNEPLNDFVNCAKETETILKETSLLIDNQVKKYESEVKGAKKEECKELFNSLIGEFKELITFEKVFDERWLNKGTKMSEIERDIKDTIEKVASGVQAIQELKSEFETEIISEFLKNYNLTEAIMKNKQLNEQKNALAKTIEAKEEAIQGTVGAMISKPLKVEDNEPIKTYTLKISCRYSVMKNLKKFMDLNKIEYEKGD